MLYVFKLVKIEGSQAIQPTSMSSEVVREGYDKFSQCMPKAMQGKF
jgi:hypothetical protein